MIAKTIEVKPLENGNTDGLYHYTVSGLNNYWLEPGLFEISEYEGEEYITFPHLFDLNAAIGMHICRLQRPLGPLEIRFIRGELDFSQAELGAVLGFKDKQRVAKAELLTDGRQFLNAAADMLLRHIYMDILGFSPLVGDDIRQAAAEMGKNMTNRRQIIEEENWQLAA